jgi:CHAD domain-containing protein
MRVASRRLRNALRLFQDHLPGDTAEKWHEEMKGITRSLGNARDLDIQIQLVVEKYQGGLGEAFQPGYERLLLKLTKRRSKTQQKVISAIYSLKQTQTIAEIRKVLQGSSQEKDCRNSPGFHKMAQDAILGRLDFFLSLQDGIFTPENAEKLHAMRIAGKHLRYTLEIFKPLYEERLTPFIEIMKCIQDQLGLIHDCDVWISWLPQFIEQERNHIKVYFGDSAPFSRILPGIEHLIADRKQTRQQEYRFFITSWQNLVTEQTWENLQKVIHTGLTPK